jgi:TPR repeat protein
MLGLILQPTDPAQALKWFKDAGDGGQSEAMVKVGLMLASGRGVDAPNLTQAAEWFDRASKRGDSSGTYLLAECYLYGKGVTQDQRQALELLNTAAVFKNLRAINMLGDLHRKGVPGLIEPDPSKAFSLFSQAKELGSADSNGYLGILYFSGAGVKQDAVKGEALFKEGAEGGSPFCMFLYAKAIEHKDLPTARTWYVRSALNNNRDAIEWCRKNNVPLTNSP